MSLVREVTVDAGDGHEIFTVYSHICCAGAAMLVKAGALEW